MVKLVTFVAYRADTWLHTRLGRGYRVLLTVGLIADIGHRLWAVPMQISSHHRLAGIILAVALEVGLLIHQVAEMNERLGFREAASAK